MDITALNTLEGVVITLQKRGVKVMLCEANPRVTGKLQHAGLTDLLGPGGLQGSLPMALQQAMLKPA
jgi:SulP family sulfate permease